MRRSGDLNRASEAVVLAAVALAASVVGGCAGRRLTAPPFAPPVMPLPQQTVARQWYRQWENEADIIEGQPVRDMLLILGTRGREWRMPEGPDGYVLRVVLLDEKGRPIRRDGSFQAFMVHRPAGPEPRAMFAWTVDSEQAARRFQEGNVPGYLLQLDWGAADSPMPEGLVMLVVRWIGPGGVNILTRNVVFEDRIQDGIETTADRP